MKIPTKYLGAVLVCAFVGWAGFYLPLTAKPEKGAPPPAGALPTICKVHSRYDSGGSCWIGKNRLLLMKGYQTVELEGGTYLVGWPKW
jgi:hypothetical protein